MSDLWYNSHPQYIEQNRRLRIAGFFGRDHHPIPVRFVDVAINLPSKPTMDDKLELLSPGTFLNVASVLKLLGCLDVTITVREKNECYLYDRKSADRT